MKTFRYIEYATCQVIFSCDANNILSADKFMEEKTGINPAKNPRVGVCIEVERTEEGFRFRECSWS